MARAVGVRRGPVVDSIPPGIERETALAASAMITQPIATRLETQVPNFGIPRWFTLSPLLAAFLLAPSPVGAVAQNDALNAEFDRIAAEVAEVRELPFTSDVPEAFLSPAELRRRLTSDLATDYPTEEMVADQRALEAFGLVPEGTDLGDLILDLLGEQIAGFYDPETDEMYVISDEPELDAVAEFTYAHEVVHALQDQAFDLERVQAATADGTDDDASLAVTALIEGDAMVGSLEYVLDHPVLLAQLALAESGDTTQLDNAPPIITRTLIFPYLAGQEFVAELRDEGGWEAVNAAFADPPASTEQILHPEKYLEAERDEPTAVGLPDLASALGPGWARAEENAFGEFQTAVVLAAEEAGQGIGSELPDAAEDAAAGWDGDRYAIWANGELDVVVWVSVWDDADEAAEFAEAANAFGEDLAAELGQQLRVEQTDATVRFVLAPSAAIADAALAGMAAG